MSPAPLRLGTRGSKLALAQAEWVARQLGGANVVTVKTADGAVGDKARFVRAIEEALLAGEVDIAVHSAKDLPGELPDGLAIGSVPAREDPADVYLGDARSIEEIARGSRTGTSSLRRRSQLLALRPDLEVTDLRGNVDTRLAKLGEGDYDGIVLAAAGLRRLGREAEAGFMFGVEEMTPAPGQGALALEVRADDKEVLGAVAAIDDQSAHSELDAERTAVAALEASCDTPVGVLARAEGSQLRIIGYAGLPDGDEWIRDDLLRSSADPVVAGNELANRMKAAGATKLLASAAAAASEAGAP